MVNNESVKRYFCGTKDLCSHKDTFVNNRCFASYAIRQSCPNIIRKDNKTWRQGSKEEEALCK